MFQLVFICAAKGCAMTRWFHRGIGFYRHFQVQYTIVLSLRHSNTDSLYAYCSF